MAAGDMSSRAHRALILDDDSEFRRVVVDALNERGFVTDEAANPVEGLSRIDDQNYHLLIFDISMTGSPSNRDWLDLLRDLRAEGKIDAAKIVVLSQFARIKQNTREAFRDYDVDDVVDRTAFDDEVFGDEMKKLVETLEFNPTLQVAWTHGDTEAAEVLVNLKIAGTRVRRNTPRHERLVAELDDLLCRLFWKAESILVSILPAGRGGAGVLRVQPTFHSGPGAPVVVKFGDVHDIEAENDHYDEYVKDFLAGARAASVKSRARTRLLGGICYALFGAEEFETFSAFYARETTAEIAKVIDNLFLSTCATWYVSPTPATYDLAKEYRTRLGMTAENLNTGWKDLKYAQGSETLKFTTLQSPLSVRNPISAAFKVINQSTFRCTTHGDLTGGNILVDHERNTWLIDFARTGVGHVLSDLALLDVFTRCALLGVDEATLDERLLLERALLEVKNFDSAGKPKVEDFATGNAALKKAFVTSLHIRALAAKHGWHRNQPRTDYDVATMFYALNMVRFYHLAPVQRMHGLLAAGLLAERLQL